jgi:ATP dependent DNA ligase domain
LSQPLVRHPAKTVAEFLYVNLDVILGNAVHHPLLGYNRINEKPAPNHPDDIVARAGAFRHPDWVFELNHDGFRCLAYIADGSCELVSRRRNVYKSFAPLKEALVELRVKNALLDGEIVCLDATGRSIFKDVLHRRGAPIFYAFDLLWLNGRDLRSLPLLDRKERLWRLLGCTPTGACSIREACRGVWSRTLSGGLRA